MDNNVEFKPLPLYKSILLFSVPSAFFCFIAYIVIPYFNKNIGIHPALSWFYGGYLVFIPLFILALLMYRLENHKMKVKLILQRFRIKRLSKTDLKWTLISAVLILFLTGLIMLLSRIISLKYGLPELKTVPPFMQFQALTGYQKLYLLVWFPMFFFNIVGEEIMWRGYILPRQELLHGKYSWIVNSILWTIFHLCFGFDLMVILLPILFIIPYVAYKTKNTTVGIITHALLNGPMFIMVSLGII